MRSKNPRGPVYGAAGAAAAVAVCLGAVALGPAAPGQPGPALARAVVQDRPGHFGGTGKGGQSFLSREEAQGGDCVLTVPADPTSASGLSTPWWLSNGPSTSDCTMANSATRGAFVQATILTPDGHLFAYDPLVSTQGVQPAVAPAALPPTAIPPGSVVTIDTGFAANILFLKGPGAGAFVQGLPDGSSPFGQVAFANGPAFFAAARAGHVTVPPPGTAADGMTCPTVRDFSLADQDPSDNVTTLYLVSGDRTAQDTAANRAVLPGAAVAGVGSDNHLLDGYVDPALGCAPFAVPVLGDPGATEATQATNELLASADQQAPAALVPVSDPMTTVGADVDIIPGDFPHAGNLSVTKTNLYRAEVGQPPLAGNGGRDVAVRDATGYCQDLKAAGARVNADARLPAELASLNVLGSGMNLSQFMLSRYAASPVLLNCGEFAGK